ncbi:hypothetical protein ABEB36_010856 [Hypothenemus hampei]|uniref:Ig-like domain-containing protein n=1 Tax=Hypothenemus hampei TaxID=57062 RepID=A0ABD1EDJ3_HYPHA
MKMKHSTKKAILTLVTLCELMMCSKVAGSIEEKGQIIEADNGNLTLYIIPTENANFTNVPTVGKSVTKRPSNFKKYETKIELGATNITRHHSFVHLNRSKPLFNLSSTRFGGPFFEEGSEAKNVTARVGSTINLNCRIGLLGNKTVTWTQKRNQNINLLTVGKNTHSKDERFHLAFRYPNNYRLKISYLTKRDDGEYECQITSHPPKVKRVYLKITAPEVKIVDESIREVNERYYRQGSSLLLTCLATSIDLTEDEKEDTNIISWKLGSQPLDKHTRGIAGCSPNRRSPIEVIKFKVSSSDSFGLGVTEMIQNLNGISFKRGAF